MNSYYATVFGAGISGLSLANALRKKGKKVLVIDPNVSDEAPGPPAGLVNPAMGRHARLSWESEACYISLKEHLDEMIKETGASDIISDSGVIRPAINEKLAANFKDSLENYQWPDGWISWLSEDEITKKVSAISKNFGGLYLNCGITVFVDRYLNTYRKYLQKNDVTIQYVPGRYEWDEAKKHFEIYHEGKHLGTSEYVIVAAGSYTPEFSDWDIAPIHLVKGQIIVYESKEVLPWDIAISAMGYALRRGDHELVVGSTYEHKFDNRDITGEAAKQIDKKLANMLSGVVDNVEPLRQMAGVRVTTPNKLPYIGRHPQNAQLCIYTGLGSKGLLFSEYVAKLLTNHLVEGTEIADELDVKRDLN